MPKLHDACQILAEEFLDQLGRLPPKAQAAHFRRCLQSLLLDFSQRHPDGVPARHFRLVLAQRLEQASLELPPLPDEGGTGPAPDLPDGSPESEGLAAARHALMESARELFP